jgi:hypothetical protein
MKRRPALIACFAGLLAGPVSARAGEPVDLTYAGGLLTIRCAEAELADVLEQVRSATGMALVLDDAVKHTLLTADIQAQPVHVALERLLEGQGVSYAMSLSPDGQKVAQMYVGTESGGKSSANTSPGRSRPPVVAVPGRPRPEPVAPPTSPFAAGFPDDDEIDAELGDDVSPFAGLAAEAMPALPSSAVSPAGASAAAGRAGAAATSGAPGTLPALPVEQKATTSANQ